VTAPTQTPGTPPSPPGGVPGPTRKSPLQEPGFPRMTEAQLLSRIREMCSWLGLLIYHTHDSRRSERGFPDLVICGSSVIYRELKSATGRVTGAQQEWLDRLTAAGADAAVWRPADLASGVVLARLGAISPRRRDSAGAR